MSSVRGIFGQLVLGVTDHGRRQGGMTPVRHVEFLHAERLLLWQKRRAMIA